MAFSLRRVLRPIVLQVLQARERWQSGVVYNPLAPRVYHNPYPTYAALRAKDPVHWGLLVDAWVCSRYADVDAILRDHKRFSNDPRKRRTSRARRAAVASSDDTNMLFADPPDHTRLRALVSKAFTPQAIDALAPRIQRIMASLLDAVTPGTPFDVMETIAYPLPVIVIAELLGVPSEDRAQFKVWSDRRARSLEPTITPREREAAAQAAVELDAYFRGIIALRRKEPQDDLISALVAAEEAGDRLSEREMVSMLRLLLVAGNETTTNLIGNGLLALLRHPEQLQRLRENPGLMPTAVEELLRYDTPVQVDARTALEELEIGGRQVAPGQGVLLLLGAANHDPEVFDNPEQLELTRTGASNLSFGRGIHHCLGAPLARLEARTAFDMLLERFAGLELLTEQPAFKDNVVLRGLEQLPVRATK
jgi:cytochrome P450